MSTQSKPALTVLSSVSELLRSNCMGELARDVELVGANVERLSKQLEHALSFLDPSNKVVSIGQANQPQPVPNIRAMREALADIRGEQ